MNLRHAAALALVGWYLMVSSANAQQPSPAAPLNPHWCSGVPASPPPPNLEQHPGEAIALKWDDVNFEKRQVLIERAMSAGILGTTKTGTVRKVDLSAELVDALKALRVERAKQKLKDKWPEMPEWVFINGEQNPLDESRLRKRFAAIMKDAKVSGHRLYDLRHTFATQLLAAGTPITYVAAQLGHSKPTTTLQWYAHWLPDTGISFVDSLDAKPAKEQPETEKATA